MVVPLSDAIAGSLAASLEDERANANRLADALHALLDVPVGGPWTVVSAGLRALEAHEDLRGPPRSGVGAGSLLDLTSEGRSVLGFSL